jgi:hypothetical protein
VPGKAPFTTRLWARLRGRQGVEGISERPIGGDETVSPQGRGWFGPRTPGGGRQLSWQGWAAAIAVTIVVILLVVLLH